MRSVVGKSLPLADRTASASSREPDFMPDAQDSARETGDNAVRGNNTEKQSFTYLSVY
ncbi:hypothetical protein DBC23_11240 [Salmonella enterica subsp. enterica serovar Ohio]|nr:hypothetical protein DBC23_11240 [Salmonella enterica subsp. enterica serovar Ohio]